MDRNSLIGFALLALLVIGYVSFNQYEQSKYNEQKKADSIAYAKAHPRPVIDSTKLLEQQVKANDAVNDSLRANLPAAYSGDAKTVNIANNDIELTFTTKGANPVSALLKDYKTYDGKPLYLFNGNENEISALLPIKNNSVSTADLYYTAVEKSEPNGDKSLVFTADIGDGQKVAITYTLPADGYMLQYKMDMDGMQANNVTMNWQTKALHTEKDLATERMHSQVYYYFKNEDYDYYTITNKDKETKKLDGETHWLGFRLQYFATALINDAGFNNVSVMGEAKPTDSNIVAVNKDVMTAPVANDGSVNLRWYVGPNHYQTLRSYKIGLDNMVPLGYGLMSFVKYVNKWLIIPIFNVLSTFITNYGVIIMLMTIIIRLILSFFTYKSYLSAAKMRVLKPELDELRAKYGDDQQKFSMEQMKLYRTAGVNPLGGCLPTLFQLPILFAMYYFFPSSIELRQESFLWANDLSTYDSIAHLPFNIPFYGDHISLFTLMMTASSLFLALYNRNMTVQDPNNPMLKWMPYVFPFLLIGVFNKMAAALTFYYFFSNVISIAQQFIIQKYIINEKAIHAKMQENRNKPATPSKWAQKLEEMQKAQLERGKQPIKKK